MTDSNQHPMWTVSVYNDTRVYIVPSKSPNEGEFAGPGYRDLWLRAPTASAALARAEALRNPTTPPATTLSPLIQQPTCLADGCGELWTVPHGTQLGVGYCNRHAARVVPPATTLQPDTAASVEVLGLRKRCSKLDAQKAAQRDVISAMIDKNAALKHKIKRQNSYIAKMKAEMGRSTTDVQAFPKGEDAGSNPADPTITHRSEAQPEVRRDSNAEDVGSSPTGPTIRVRACIAVVNGKLWGAIGYIGWNDDEAKQQAQDLAGAFQGDDVQFSFGHIDVPLRQPAEITGAVEPPKEAP